MNVGHLKRALSHSADGLAVEVLDCGEVDSVWSVEGVVFLGTKSKGGSSTTKEQSSYTLKQILEACLQHDADSGAYPEDLWQGKAVYEDICRKFEVSESVTTEEWVESIKQLKRGEKPPLA